MRKIIDKLIGWLNAIGKDKYQHFGLGAIIASVALCVASPLPFPAANFISIVAVFCVELIKELVVDSSASYRDLIATMLGGATVWVAASFTYGYA